MLFEIIILSALLLYLLFRSGNGKYEYFKKRDLPFAKAQGFFSLFVKMYIKGISIFEIAVDQYNECDAPVYGTFDRGQPVHMIRDPELIKQITIKDFDHFVNRRPVFHDDDNDEEGAIDNDNIGNKTGLNLMGASLFMMKNSKWKDMRSTLSPAFTGNKMRQMFQLMNQVAQETLLYFKKQNGVCSKEGLDLEIKDFITRFTSDIIASTAFGLQVNSYEQKDNQFYKMGKSVVRFSFIQSIKFLLLLTFKNIVKFFKIEVFDRESTQYFMHLVLDAMKYRQEHNIIRPDMINMLMESRGMLKSENPKPHSRNWSDVDIVAQCFLFFVAGFENSALLTCFTLHELMENPECQDKLLQEILRVEQELDGSLINYEALQAMPYMDMVVQECLRKWPAAIAIDRVCTKDITYSLRNGKQLQLKVGDCIWISVVGLHRDSQHFENPLKFDPDRFSDENKGDIKPCTYLPFGTGPRNCIASRFALLETKVLVYYLIRDFKIEAAKKSSIPIKLSSSGFQLTPKNGFWLKFKTREI